MVLSVWERYFAALEFNESYDKDVKAHICLPVSFCASKSRHRSKYITCSPQLSPGEGRRYKIRAKYMNIRPTVWFRTTGVAHSPAHMAKVRRQEPKVFPLAKLGVTLPTYCIGPLLFARRPLRSLWSASRVSH